MAFSTDFGTPIGQDAAFNPEQAIQTLSGLVGVEQQQQNLQTGQYVQASAQAQSQQDQQRNSELQALHQFAVSASTDPAYQNADGSLNVQKFQQDALSRAPVYGSQYIGQITANANQGVANRAALLNLSNEQRSTVSNYLSAVAQKPNATTADLLDAVGQARQVSDDPGYQRTLDSFLMHAPQTVPLPSNQASAAIRTYAAHGARYSATAGGQAPTGAGSTAGAPGPNPAGGMPAAGGAAPIAGNAPLSPAQLDALRLRSQEAGNAANQPQYAPYTGPDSQTHYAQVNPNAPGGQRSDLGTTLPQGMTPSERYGITMGPGNQLVLTDRATGRVMPFGGSTGGGSPSSGSPAPAGNFIGRDPSGRVLTSETDPNRPGVNAPGASWQAWNQSVQQAQASVQGAREADAQYGNQMAIADQVRRLSLSSNTGPGTPDWTRTVGLITSRFGGSQGVTNVQTLESFLDRQAASMREGMGLPQTNAGQEAANVIAGNIGMQGGALRAKNDYNQALAQGLHDYRTGLDHVEGFTGDPSPSAVNRFKAQWAANYDPLAYEYKLAKERGDRGSVAAITNRLSPTQARAMLTHLQATDRLMQGLSP